MRILLLSLVCTLLSWGAGAKTIKKKSSYFKLLEATSQRTLPGIPGVAIRTETHFIIVWQSVTSPKAFSWQGEDGWMLCSIQKRNKGKNGRQGHAAFAEVVGSTIHRGDTLQLTPVQGEKRAAPAEIPTDAKNTLFFKAGNSGWLSFPIDKIKRLPDIVNP